MPRNGYVIVGGKRFVNQWAEPGKTYRLVLCKICGDTGRLYDDNGKFEDFCDCRRGDAQRYSGGAA